MAKGDHDNAMNAVNTNRNQFNGQYGALNNEFGNQYSNAYKSDQGLKGQITQGYTNYMNPENVNAMFSGAYGSNLADIASGNFDVGGASGGIDEGLIKGMGVVPYGEYSKLSQQGNDYINPNFKTDFAKSMAGVDTANKSYQDFIDTGGFSQSDIQAMRSQAEAPSKQIYSNAQDNLTRSNAISGGNLGNASVAQYRMANDAADKIGAIDTNTEANLAQMKQQGKEFGTTGLGQTSLAQAQAKTAVQQLDAQLKEAGLAGMTDIEKSRLQAELQNAQINEQASATNANIKLGKAGLQLNANNALIGLDKLKADYGMDAAKGLTQLYGTAPADTALAGNQMLQLQQLFQSGQLGLNGNQIGASQIPGNFNQAMGNLSSVFGLAGDVAGGISGGMFGNGLSSMFNRGNNSSNPYQTMFGGGSNYFGY